jgi:hypothetical protein
MKFCIIGISCLIVAQSTARSDDLKDAVETAYCVGVDLGDIDHDRRILGNVKNDNIRELESKNVQREMLLNRVMREGKIDAGTVQKVKSSGYIESTVCWKKSTNVRPVSKHSAKKQSADCKAVSDVLCEPTYVCDNY